MLLRAIFNFKIIPGNSLFILLLMYDRFGEPLLTIYFKKEKEST